MTNSKSPNVTVEIFKIANRLKEKLGLQAKNTPPGHIDSDAIKEADKLIKALCSECPETIAAHLKTLNGLWDEMRDMPDSQERKESGQEIFTLSHEIKDVGSMCGYTLLAYFAESLRDYIGQTELNMDAQRVIIQAHMDAMTLVHKQDIKDDAGAQAEELKKMVKIAIEKYS